MTIVLDTGALIALDRGSRTVLSRLQTAFDKGDEVQVPAGVIGQAWRQPNPHALLSRALKRCEEVAVPVLAYPVLTFVLDAGALIAVDRGDREVLSILQTAFEHGYSVRVPAGVVGQVWRNPNRQVVPARTLKRCNEVALDGSMARAAGRLCGWVGTSDVIDASVAIVASHTDRQGVTT